MTQLLFYADEKALAAYLGGAALLEAGLAQTPCESLVLTPAAKGANEPPRPALLFEGALELPVDQTRSTLLYTADFDRDRGVVTVKDGRKRATYKVTGGDPAPRELAQVLAPIPWSRTPETSEVIYLVAPGVSFSRLVTQHLELGRDQLRYALVETAEDGPRVLVEVPDPSWFLLERWLEDHADEARVFRRLIGSLGPRPIYIEWGYRHPLEDWLVDPGRDGLLLLIDREGRHRTLERGELADIGNVLGLDPTAFPTEALEATREPERVKVELRLEGRTSPRDPELWILPVRERHRLEELLTHTPEEELRNLMVACVAPPGGERLFAVREILTGRAPRLLPLGKRAYAPMPQLPNLLVPCPSTIAPPLSSERYQVAFDLRPGQLTVLDEQPGEPRGRITVTKVSERAFKPVERIVDFVFDGHAEEIEEVMLAAPFDLGRFAEEDLIPQALEREQRAKAPKPKEPKPRREQPEPKKAPKKKGFIQKLLQPFQTATKKPTEAAAEVDPRRKEIEALQREIVLSESGPAHWLKLSRLLYEDGQADEGLRAMENGIWELAGDDRRDALEHLSQTLGGGSATAKDTAELYRRTFTYGRELGEGDADTYRQSTERMYQELRDQEDRLRKKSRWILWRLVLGETGDAIEAERQREAILGDLVLRGIEEREVPPFVRHLLLEHYGQKAATGSGASEALAFLENAQTFAASLKHPAFQAEALSHVAWALAELGQGERALKVAKLAERQASSSAGAPPHHAWRARAIARCGAVLERVKGRDQGRALLERSLAQITKQLPTKSAGQSQETVDARKAFVAWLGALADAWSTGERGDDALVKQALEVLESRPPNDQSMIIHEAPEVLQRLGLNEAARELVQRLMRDDSLRLAREHVRDLQYPDEAFKVHVQNAMECLERFRGGQSIPPAEAQAIVNLLKNQPELIDEFTIQPLLVSLRGIDAPPWEEVQGLVDELLRRGHRYEAGLVRIAGINRLAELRDRDRGPDLLAQALDEAWALPDDSKKPRHRVITRLVSLIPAFGMRGRGLEMLQAVNQRVQEQPHEGVFVRNELLLATAMAASKLGDSRASFELIEETANLAMREFQKAGRDGPSWLLFETLDECVKGAAELGETRRGLELVGTVAETARAALAQTEGRARGEGPYFYCRTLIKCGRASLQLGDSERATAEFTFAFTRLNELNTYDQTELLQEAATIAGLLEGARRYQLARRVLEAAESPVASGTQDRFAMDLTSQIARDMVKGESAFASALKRWKGREERLIRDLVAHEQIAG